MLRPTAMLLQPNLKELLMACSGRGWCTASGVPGESIGDKPPIDPTAGGTPVTYVQMPVRPHPSRVATPPAKTSKEQVSYIMYNQGGRAHDGEAMWTTVRHRPGAVAEVVWRGASTKPRCQQQNQTVPSCWKARSTTGLQRGPSAAAAPPVSPVALTERVKRRVQHRRSPGNSSISRL